MKKEFKTRRLVAVVFCAALLWIAGCGSGANSRFTDPYGNVVGYVYTANYNSGLARVAGDEGAVAAGRAAAAPAGYVVVSGAKVEIAELGVSTTTDANGYFYLGDIRPGAVVLTISKAGMETITLNVTVSSGGTADANSQNSNEALKMAPADNGTIVITTTAGSGAYVVPVSGAAISINGTATGKTTDAQGQAVINDVRQLAAGENPYTVAVSATGYDAPLPKSVSVTSAAPTAAVNFTMVPSDGNNAPFPTITLPTDGQTFNRGATATLSGGAVDPEDGNLSGSALVWSSSLDGQIGTGALVQTASLSPGAHTITLTGTDSGGKSGAATVKITVLGTEVANTAPSATIFTPVNNASYTDDQTITFTGAGADAEEGNLSGSFLVWTSSRDGNLGTGTAIQKSGLSVGVHTITLTVTDSKGTTGTASVSITVNSASVVNSAPTAFIATPADGATGTTLTRFTFSGTGVDPDEGNLAAERLVWSSSISGALGTGNLITKNLSAGTHVVTLTVTDTYGLTGSSNVTVIVTQDAATNTVPTAVIATPIDGATATTGTTINFSGTGVDTEDGNLTGSSLVWTSNLDGQLGTGNYFTKTLSAGTHVITLTATDSGGMTDTATVSVVIGGGNTAPTATMITPLSGTVYTNVTTITFTGAGMDPEDGALTGSSLVWTSDIDGQIGTGNYFTRTLSIGTHTIKLKVKDSNGATDTVTRSIRVF